MSLSEAAQNLILDIDAGRVTATDAGQTWLVYDGDQQESKVNPRTRRALLDGDVPLAVMRVRMPTIHVDLTVFGAQVADDIKNRRDHGLATPQRRELR